MQSHKVHFPSPSQALILGLFLNLSSTYFSFGSGIIPTNYGFPLQNRGAGFVVSPADHPNVLAPNKRPYHTIIPAMLTTPHPSHDKIGINCDPQDAPQQLDTIFGVMGGYMQPQGHVQVLLNLLAWKMSPQEALDAPRVCIGSGYSKDMQAVVNVEAGIPDEVITGLKGLGYEAALVGGNPEGRGRELFGRGQVVRLREEMVRSEKEKEPHKVRIWSGGSDMRGDGCCVGY